MARALRLSTRRVGTRSNHGQCRGGGHEKGRTTFHVVGAVVAMLAANWFAPVGRVFWPPWQWPGLVPPALGAALTTSTLILFHCRGTTARPFGASATRVTSGPFRVARHPMYAGIILMLSVVAWLLGTLGPWLVAPVVGIVLDRVFVRGEEGRTETTSGDAYRQYKSKVRRRL